jgi:chromate transport protein ChrA
MDVDQCIDVWRVLRRCANEIKSLGLQKITIVAIVGFSGVPSSLLTLLLVMVVVVPIVVTAQEYKKKKK